MRIIAVVFYFSFTIVSAQIVDRNHEIPRDTLATVESHVINAKDFLERFELMPWPNKDKKDRIEYTKLMFLHSMVAEKLLAVEASSQNIGGDSVTVEMQENLERMFVRDEFYRREVVNNISVSQSEIREGLGRISFEMQVEVLGILSKNEGELLYSKVSQSKNKRSTFSFFKDSLYVPIDTLTVALGFSDRQIEDAVFSIKNDSLSKPIESKVYGWVMFRLLKKYSNEQYSRLSQPDKVSKVRTIIKGRKEDSLAAKAFAAVTSPQRAEADIVLFNILSDSISALLRSDSAEYFSKNVYMLPAAAINGLQKTLSKHLNEKFVTIASGDMTLKQVLIGLSNNYVVFPTLQPEHIRHILNNNIKTVIQNEMLAREGLKKNLQHSEIVRHDIATWVDNRKSMLLMRNVIDTVTVSDTDIEAEYLSNPQRYGASVFVKIRGILVDSFAVAKDVRRRIDAGGQFDKLATQYSKRKEWLTNDMRWQNVVELGEVGTFAATVAIGTTVGPLKVKDGYVIVSVAERKVVDDSIRKNFSEIKKSIGNKLRLAKQQKTLDKFIGTLAKKYEVTINADALRDVKTTTTSMVTWRHIGFGGRIVAVPQTIPQTEWIYEWKKQELLNQ